MSEFQVCDGVKWEVSNGQSGVARFSEVGLADPRHSFLFDAVRSACVDDLVGMLGEPIGSGKFGEVRPLIEAPHLVAKLHSEPFTNTAINICLEAGLPRVEGALELTAPQYIGHVQGFNPLENSPNFTSMTLMSKIEGSNLASFLVDGQIEIFREGTERKEIVRIGCEAVKSVGRNPNMAYWADVHEENLIVTGEVQTLEEAYQSQIALIDIPTRAWAESVRVAQ